MTRPVDQPSAGRHRLAPARLAAFGLALVALVVAAAPAVADWTESALAICTEAGDQQSIAAAADGEGGMILVWQDARSGTLDVYARRVDALGTRLWAFNGIPVCQEAGAQQNPRIVAVSNGEFVVVWEDGRGGNLDLYAQKLDLDGNALWTAGGVPACQAAGDQANLQVMADGDHAIVAWEDLRNGNRDVYIQRLDAAGTRVWSPGGLPVTTATGHQSSVQVAPELDGSTWVVYVDESMSSILTALVDDLGGVTPVATLSGSDPASSPSICGDGQGGIYCAFDIYVVATGDADVAVRHVSAGGTTLTPWMLPAVVCDDPSAQGSATAVTGAAGDALIVWQDTRGSGVYAQRIDRLCAVYWPQDGIPLVAAQAVSATEVRAVGDGAGGVLATWLKTSSGSSASLIVAQRVSAAGEPLWGIYGTSILYGGMMGVPQSVVPDGEGGLLAGVLVQQPSYEIDVYAQRIERSGEWGYPAPAITAVSDVALDQGGTVLVNWNPSRLDSAADRKVDHYSIWRSLGSVPAKDSAPSASPAALPSGPGAVRTTVTAGEKLYWEWIADREAHVLEGYAYAAPTLRDSTSADPAVHTFLVSAHAADPGVWWDSLPVSGHSVDNLAPATPSALVAEAQYAPEGLRLSWNANCEPDLQGYVLHRGATVDFTPGPATLVAVTADTTTVDSGWSPGSSWYYKLAAADVHENVSGYAVLAPAAVTGTGDLPAARPTALLPNRPNPFNPLTQVRFTLASAGPVSVTVHDAAGRLVRRLIGAELIAGAHEVLWNGRDESGREVPSGVYFCRLQAQGSMWTGKMMLVR
ncbi:MAG: FlgD immunoglobulin-like domain containing protein [Candidatus Krumholzibacteriia bacterium]